ncbi:MULTISPECIES: hypothetical protein [Dietzia]|uniref:hypothetical protein n=1 Tax=Dietzia TaxID=37914 RepID=UPI000D09744E|nr:MULTISPECIES: hypothetical protein [Dietzia]AVM63155.1 hypothetical protein C3V38_00755 [Dietzia sp. oral taxon 368]MCT1712156.1 hypothetical protein [Dietzia cinnamea]MCT2058236.1 hypothetical protein [Dietzia cinnamea]MCT2121615.1 hypothetical protein [Dietzia cinnamea]MCT2140558.1 hypothetical protein [Dietzia cinnamea]
MSTWPDWIVVAIVVAVSLLASAGLGSPIASLVLRSARVPEPPTVEISGDARQPVMRRRDDPAPQVREVLRGGMWIGILERLGLTAAILAGRFELAAVVVAIKALGRYPEIRENPAVSERFIIGTLASLLVAGACGAAGLAVLHALG